MTIWLESKPEPVIRPDHRLIIDWVEPGSRVLDLGCGDGNLLRALREQRQVHGYGVEIDATAISSCLRAGINVIETDLEEGLDDFADQTFDYVIMSQTLQTLHHTERLLDDMLRVGREGIVTLPNFGYWRCRLQLLGGKMPVVRNLPYAWYDTPNVHLSTLRDFEQLCHRKGLPILERVIGDDHYHTRSLQHMLPNLLAELALYRLGSRLAEATG